MTTRTAPATEAGRVHGTGGKHELRPVDPESTCDVTRAILAIEAQARSTPAETLDVELLAEALRVCGPFPNQHAANRRYAESVAAEYAYLRSRESKP